MRIDRRRFLVASGGAASAGWLAPPSAVLRYPSGVELHVRDEGRAGLLFEGDAGRLFVNRSALEGAPVEALRDRPLPREQFSLYGFDNAERPERSGKLDAIVNHMGTSSTASASGRRRSPTSKVSTAARPPATS